MVKCKDAEMTCSCSCIKVMREKKNIRVKMSRFLMEKKFGLWIKEGIQLRNRFVDIHLNTQRA